MEGQKRGEPQHGKWSNGRTRYSFFLQEKNKWQSDKRTRLKTGVVVSSKYISSPGLERTPKLACFGKRVPSTVFENHQGPKLGTTVRGLTLFFHACLSIILLPYCLTTNAVHGLWTLGTCRTTAISDCECDALCLDMLQRCTLCTITKPDFRVEN